MKPMGITKTVQKHINQQQIIKLISRTELCNRVYLAQSLNLTTAAMTKLVAPLISQGLVSEVKAKKSSTGRKPMILSLVPQKCTILAVRIERRKFAIAAYDFCGKEIMLVNNFFGKSMSPEEVMDNIIAGLLEMKASCPNPLAVGIAVPGPFSMEKERVMLMSGFPGWENIEIRSRIQEAVGLNAFIDQDANCGAFAELWYEKEDIENLIFVVAERGVGAGIVIDGKILHGNCGYAGEFGHMSVDMNGNICECGNKGCLEMYASYNIFEFNYLKAIGGSKIGVDELFALVEQGDETAVKFYREVVEALSMGVVNIANIIDPQLIVFTHHLTKPGQLFLDIMDEVFKKRMMPELYTKLKFRLSTIPGDPSIVGAALMAFDRMIEEHFEKILV